MNDTPAVPIAAPSPAPAAGERRIDLLVGDRACTACGFNLAGQPIVREPHYGLLIVRCAECGTPASLQEYPLLGKWANRVAFALAGGWLAALLAGAVVSALLITAFSAGFLQNAVMPFARYIAAEYGVEGAGEPFAGWSQVDPLWWEEHGGWELFRRAGGWGAVIDWSRLPWFLIPLLLVVFPIGMAWATALPHVRVRRALVVTAALVLLAAPFSLLFRFDPWQQSAQSHASKLLWWPLMGGLLGASAVALFLGMLAGRPFARLAITLLLPPRLRVPFSFLWAADGKPLPRPDPVWLNGRGPRSSGTAGG